MLVDLDILERNIARMQERARAAGVKLRPHAKTHKCLEIGRMQLAAGAAGLTLAKTSEAEVFVREGFEDLFLANTIVGALQARRLAALADRARLAVGVDSEDGARALGEPFRAAGKRVAVLLEVDCGFHRAGVAPESVLWTAEKISEIPGIELRGVFTHAGQGYSAATPDELARTGAEEGRTLAAAAEELRSAGLPIEEVSVGSTPTVRHAIGEKGVTECRPGTYVFHDASQVALGVATREDCAMTILATVVSVPAPDRAVVDAGSKTLSSDPLRPRAGGHGLLLGTESRLERLSEEHGVVRIAPGDRFRVGDRVRILPNHACVVVNLHDRIRGVRGDRVEVEWPVAARGCVE